jgi:hypothetical protein
LRKSRTDGKEHGAGYSAWTFPGQRSAMHTSCPMEAEKRRSAGEAEQYLCEVTVPNRPRKEQQILFSDRFFRGEG